MLLLLWGGVLQPVMSGPGLLAIYMSGAVGATTLLLGIVVISSVRGLHTLHISCWYQYACIAAIAVRLVIAGPVWWSVQC